MRLHEAIDQVDSIWNHIARTERFQGYRPATVAATGFLGVMAAMVQPWTCPDPTIEPDGYLQLWASVALACAILVGVEMTISYCSSYSRLEKKLTQNAIQQFLPCLLGGALITWFLPEVTPQAAQLMPGLWSICFSLGILASLPFVTPNVIWVAFFYLLAGSLWLSHGDTSMPLHPWVMGGTFGGGQLLMSGILWLNERKRHDTR